MTKKLIILFIISKGPIISILSKIQGQPDPGQRYYIFR